MFDGYQSLESTKVSEQHLRAKKGASKDILFGADMISVIPQDSFLKNNTNKTRFMKLLIQESGKHDISAIQAKPDAYYLIVSTILEKSSESENPVILIGNDTDLLVMLVSHSSFNCNTYIIMETNPATIYNIKEIQQKFATPYGDLLLLIHCITGCDTTSTCYGKA